MIYLLLSLQLADNPISTEGALEIVKLIKNKPSIKISKLDISVRPDLIGYLKPLNVWCI